MERNFMGQPQLNPELPLLERPTNDKYVLAAQISRQAQDRKHADVGQAGRAADSRAKTGRRAKPATPRPSAETEGRQAGDGKDKRQSRPTPKAEPEINVVLVGDIDCLYGAFFRLRARGEDPDEQFDFHFDNVPFVLNVLDTLAGDERFVEIRTRQPGPSQL